MWGMAELAITHKLPTPQINYDPETRDIDPSKLDPSLLELFGGDKKLMIYVFGENATETLKISEIARYISDRKDSVAWKELYPDSASREKAAKTLEKLLQFTEGFFRVAASNPDIHLGMSADITKIGSERAFKLSSFGIIYSTLWGKSLERFSELSTIEQAQIYGIMLMIFGSADQTFSGNMQAGELRTRYFAELMENSKREIPQNFRQFAKDAGSYVWDKALDTVASGAGLIAGMAKASPRLAAIFAALNIPFIPARDAVKDYILF
jgi:hypothetical protein